MLDVLLEALLDAITGKQPKKAAPTRQRRQSPSDARQAESRPTQDPFRREEPAEEAPEEPRAMTFEDLIRRMTGTEEEAPPQPARRQSSRREEQRPVAEIAPPPAPPPKMPRLTTAEKREIVAEENERSQMRAKRGKSEYVDRLRGNPRAARDAFVYGEIFGRPLAERDHLQ